MYKLKNKKYKKAHVYYKCKPKKITLKHGRVPDRYFNKRELKIGSEIEEEHTNKDYIAKQIAKAHLKEDKNYYKNTMFKKERKKVIKEMKK